MVYKRVYTCVKVVYKFGKTTNAHRHINLFLLSEYIMKTGGLFSSSSLHSTNLKES